MLEKLKDLISHDIEDSETIEMFNYALETSNSLIRKNTKLAIFQFELKGINIKC